MPATPIRVSVTDPISPALQRVKQILFSPFDIKKWFVIGFCAWLSSCGESGGGGGGGGGGNQGGNSVHREDFRQGLANVWSYIVENLTWIIPLVIFVILFAVTIWLIATWLNSRGKFMLLHCVALNRAEVQVPWNRYAQHAHSLFLFQACLGAVSFVIIFPLILGSIGVVLQAVARESSLVGPIIIAVLAVLCAIVTGVCFAVVKKLLVDFVVPIMYLRTTSVLSAWREFRALGSENIGRVALYILFSVVIGLVLATLILLVVVVTCCIAGCLMAIPYIGTVLLLPVFVFKRAYSLYYLEQYGTEYTVIALDPQPPAPSGLQPVQA